MPLLLECLSNGTFTYQKDASSRNTVATYNRPSPDETSPYFGKYVVNAPDGDILEQLEQQRVDTNQFIKSIDEAAGGYRYAEGKWSVKEVIGHLIDGERVFAYRAMRIARGDRTPMVGFEQDDYVSQTDFGRRTLEDLAEELSINRLASILMFRSFTDEEIARSGTASGSPFTARVIPFLLVGHQQHHIDVIRERYLAAFSANAG